MGRKALLIEDQIKLLKNRGLVIKDDAKAEEHLGMAAESRERYGKA